MDETTTKLLELLETMRTEVADGMAKISQRCDALDEKLKKADTAGHRSRDGDQMRSDDGDDESSTLATRTAADAVTRGELEVVRAQLRDLQIKQPTRRTNDDLNKFASVQAAADSAYVALGERAFPPMSGETLLDYTCRLHRPLQRHSAKWKSAELAAIARDPSTLAVACDAIRADATQAGLNPVDLPMFAHRLIEEHMPTGHISRRFVGTGTIFKQLSRPVRHVAGFHIENRFGQPGVSGSASGRIN